MGEIFFSSWGENDAPVKGRAARLQRTVVLYLEILEFGSLAFFSAFRVKKNVTLLSLTPKK